MIPPTLREQFMLVAATDHLVIARTIETFRNLQSGDNRSDGAQEFAELEALLRHKLAAHFAYEEANIYFPLLADKPPAATVMLVVELYQGHVGLLQQALPLAGQLAGRSMANCPAELWPALRRFITALEEHTAKEDALFRPATAPPPQT